MRDFTEIVEIYEVSSNYEVNGFLAAGWKLLEIYFRTTANLQINQTIPCFILGRPQNISLSACDLKKKLEEELEEKCRRISEI